MNMHVQPERLVISAGEVAALLGRGSLSKERRAALEAAGFPRKLPGINGWSKPAIVRWLETNGQADEEPARAPTPLERRFA